MKALLMTIFMLVAGTTYALDNKFQVGDILKVTSGPDENKVVKVIDVREFEGNVYYVVISDTEERVKYYGMFQEGDLSYQ